MPRSNYDDHGAVDAALIKQRDIAVEALVWAFEERPGWREKIVTAIKLQPKSLLDCFKASRTGK